jgi:hypothetical protein
MSVRTAAISAFTGRGDAASAALSLGKDMRHPARRVGASSNPSARMQNSVPPNAVNGTIDNATGREVRQALDESRTMIDQAAAPGAAAWNNT